jgi:hypothetical protein
MACRIVSGAMRRSVAIEGALAAPVVGSDELWQLAQR